MKQWFKFCMWEASRYLDTARDHPQKVIRKYFPDASNWCPESIAECWFFMAEPNDTHKPEGVFELAPGYATSPVAQASMRGENMAR